MRKIILTTIGASVMLLSVAQIASAGDQQNGRHVTRQSRTIANENARNANAAYVGGAQSVYGGNAASNYGSGNADASLVAPAGR